MVLRQEGNENLFSIVDRATWVMVKFTAEKQLFLNTELRKKGSVVADTTSRAQASQRLPTESEGMTQLRAQQETGAEKYRITVDLHTVVEGVFDPAVAEPTGDIIEAAVVFPGQYARASNLTDDGLFIEDEVIEVGRTKLVRKAGSSAKGLMAPFLAVRKEFPHLFKYIDLCISHRAQT